MTDSSETAYRLRFVPRDDGTVAVTVTVSFDAPNDPSPLGWFSDATSFEVGPVMLSDAEASRLLEQLEPITELIASAAAKQRLVNTDNQIPAVESIPTRERPDQDGTTGPLGRPSEVRLRR